MLSYLLAKASSAEVWGRDKYLISAKISVLLVVAKSHAESRKQIASSMVGSDDLAEHFSMGRLRSRPQNVL
jgi:hypothetical protein